MIERIRIQNYKALRDVAIELTPIHVLIGPNDSGKTSILESLLAICRSVDFPISETFVGPWDGRGLVWQRLSDRVRLDVSFRTDESQLAYGVECEFSSAGREVFVTNETITSSGEGALFAPGQKSRATFAYQVAHKNDGPAGEARSDLIRVWNALSGVQYYRWDPRLLSLPVAPDSNRQFRMDPSGFGLALCLDDILGFDRGRFNALEHRFRKIFPQIRSIKLVAQSAYRAPLDAARPVPMLQAAEGKGIYFEFMNSGELVAAAQVSDGILLVLAYLAILYSPKPPRVLLIEEPENGIHPKRLNDVLGILRELVEEQSHTQIAMTTHSPYVVDLFKRDEVSLCIKGDDGAVSVHPLSQSSTVDRQHAIFSLGEIWTAEGDEDLARPIAPAADVQQ